MEGRLTRVDVGKADAMKGRFMAFLIGNEIYGIDISYVMEIVGVQPITPMPETPEYIIGIVNLRGKIIPIMDARLRLKKEARPYDDRTCVIIVKCSDAWFGLIVDGVSEVILLAEDEIVDKPETLGNNGKSFVKGIGKKEDQMILLLDCEMLIESGN